MPTVNVFSASSLSELAAHIAAELFEETRASIHSVASQVNAAGMDDRDATELMLTLAAKSAVAAAAYAAYLSCGLFLCDSDKENGEETAKLGMSALSKDLTLAVESGFEMAKNRTKEVRKMLDEAGGDTEELLRRAAAAMRAGDGLNPESMRAEKKKAAKDKGDVPPGGKKWH